MKFRAEIDVMPMDEILDPQGRVVNESLHNLGLREIENVRIGKHIRLLLDAADLREAEGIVDTACRKLLANLIMERYTFRIEEV
jgi:phosphoribosylformylglycinamidine synthase